MFHRLSRLSAKLFGPREDADIIAKYVGEVSGYALREGLIPLTVEAFTRYVIHDMPTPVIRALLKAYDAQIDPATFNIVTAEPAGDSKDVSPEVVEIISRAHFMAKSSRQRVRIVDPADVLVSLAMHPTSAALLDRIGLTKLKITYFLSHGRALPAVREAELQDLPERSGEAFVLIKNDDYTPMELVTTVLGDVFDFSTAHAEEMMWTIHQHQEAFVGPYSYEGARERVARAIAVVREAGAPLLFSLARGHSLKFSDALRDAKHERLRRISAKQGRPIGFIRQHWRGERSFAASFWVVGVIGTIVLRYGYAALLSAAMLHVSPRALLGVMLPTAVLFIATLSWQWTGVWRAASRYKTTKLRKYLGTGVQAAMAVAWLGMVGFAIRVLPHLQGIDQVFSDTQPIPSYTVTLESRDTVLFNGGFRLGASHSLKLMLDAHPEIRVVHLESPGGLAPESALMRNLIQERGLITYVSGFCASACPLAYVGGSRRYLSEDGELAFHRGRHGRRPDAPEDSSFAASLLRRSGVSQAFIEQVANTPAADLWSPSHEKLLEAGVVHEIGAPPGSGEI